MRSRPATRTAFASVNLKSAGRALCRFVPTLLGNIVSIPALSRPRQLLLAIFGTVLVAIGFWQLNALKEEALAQQDSSDIEQQEPSSSSDAAKQ